MIQTSVLVDDQDPIPQSPFRLLLENLLTFTEPLICEEFFRCKDNKIVALQVFDDQIVEVCCKKKSILLLEEEIFFGWCSNDRKIWFKNRENQDIQVFTSESLNNLINFVEVLKKRCDKKISYQNMIYWNKKGKEKIHVFIKEKEGQMEDLMPSKYKNMYFKHFIKTSQLANEIRTLSQLQHPNIIYFHEYFIDTKNIVHIVMDYEDGGSLLDVIRRNQQLSPKDKVKIFMDLLNGLEYLRIKGIVHRDLKPQNILFSKKDRNYKIADFGLSKRVGQKLHKIAGTPGYMAPELLKSESKQMTADIKSDIYSMGLIFYQILTLHQYYQGKDTQQILRRNMQKTSLKKKNKCENLINNLQYILLEKMIRSEPEKRKSSYQILKSSLFSKINKLYGLELLSSTSPSKKISDDNEEDENNDGFVDSIWKFLRSRSWSTST